jgi:hypothetical protein
MNEKIKQLAEQAGATVLTTHGMEHVVDGCYVIGPARLEKFAELVVQECIDKIETHQIPVGNSAAGEMACEWTYAALKEIRDEIKEHFGVKNERTN